MAQENIQSLYKKALDNLALGKYPEAQKDLETLYSSGWRSPGLNFYLGRSLVANKNYGAGLWHLNHALKKDRFNSDIRNDIELAEKLVSAGRGTPMEHPSEWAFSIQSYLRAEEQFFIAAFIGLALLATKFIAPLNKKYLSLGLALIGILVISGLFTMYGNSFAVVQKDVAVRAAPLDAAEESGQATNGVRVRVLRKNDSFSEVERVGSFRGWINNDALLFYN